MRRHRVLHRTSYLPVVYHSILTCKSHCCFVHPLGETTKVENTPSFTTRLLHNHEFKLDFEKANQVRYVRRYLFSTAELNLICDIAVDNRVVQPSGKLIFRYSSQEPTPRAAQSHRGGRVSSPNRRDTPTPNSHATIERPLPLSPAAARCAEQVWRA